MPRKSPLIRVIGCAARGDVEGGVRALDAMTPWRGVLEVGADLAGPPLVRALASAIARGRAEFARELRELADELDAAT